ncbi:MAG: GtrA family protein [Candidatus Falkowbacteria bacterium]|nr:GtrA family protein [Candidatus Falkowbacteria bacterium]
MNKFLLFVKYAIGGAIATLIELVILYILTDQLGIWYVYSSLVAYAFGFISSFFIRKIWAFEDYDFKKVGRQFLIYASVLGISMLLFNTAALIFMVERLHIPYLLAQFFSGLVVGFLGFFINEKVTFKQK